MALNPRSVDTVTELFSELFPDLHIEYRERNQYGADEVYILSERMIQTPELHRIVDCSKKIGNTVSVGSVKDHAGTCVCFW